MASKAKPSKGTILKRGDGGSPETFTAIGEILSFEGPNEVAGSIDVTSMDSVAREYVSDGLPDGGEFTMEMNFVGSDAQQQALRADLRAGTKKNWQLLLNDHATNKTTFEFAAFVIGFNGPTAGVGEQYKASITMKVTDQPTITYAPGV